MAILDRSAEIEALRDSAARFVQNACAEDDAAGDVQAGRWQTMAELGWLGAAVSEGGGGLALPLSALSELVEVLGPALMNESLHSHFAFAAHLLDCANPTPRRDALLESVIAGHSRVALAHHERRTGPRFGQAPQARVTSTADGIVLHGTKVTVSDGGNADELLVTACAVDQAHAAVLVCVPVTARGVEVSVVPTFDGRTLADVRFDNVVLDASDCMTFPGDTLVVVDQAQDLHAFLLTSESLGIVRVLLCETHAYLAQRAQFGIRLNELQVLQHRLVDMQLALTRLESQVMLTRCRIDDDGIGAAARFISATALLGARTARFIGKQAVQLHGAIGMTEELRVGAWFKRLTANELAGGTGAEHTARRAQAMAAAAGLT